MVGVGMLCAAAWSPPRLGAQRGGVFMGSADDPAIAYSTAPVNNVVDDLNRKLQDGSAGLTFEGRSGYLASAIDALKLPVDSQLLLFSKASLQGRLINPSNPRALFFNDRVVLGWVRDGDLIEVAAHDEKEGVVFYSLEQRPAERPSFKREFRCLGCHMTGDTLGVPGLLMFSETPDDRRSADEDRDDGPAQSAGRAMGRLVRHGQQWRGAASRQPGAGARGPSGRRRAVGGGTLRSRWVSRDVERYRRPSDVLAPDPHDQSADPRVVGGARRRSGAASGGSGGGRSAAARGGDDERRRRRSRRLHAVCRRSAAAERGQRSIRFCRADVGERAARPPGTVALRARSEDDA